MNIILLSGGSGKRLWPLSNEIRSKQFIKMFRRPEGTNGYTPGNEEYESMVQRVYRQIKTVEPDATVTIATSKSQVSAIHNQLGTEVGISVEPCRRDTFAAIALATAYLNQEKGVPEDEAIVVCPVDPYVDEAYFHCMKDMCMQAQTGNENLVLMGITPSYPSEKYGYINPISDENGLHFSFIEKPFAEDAKNYIEAGALWNGGVFSYKISYLLEKSKELLGTFDYAELLKNYESLKKISFDYAVVEQEKSIKVVRYHGSWKDIGTWSALTEVMDEQSIGDARCDDTCSNVNVINELGVPIVAMGLKDTVISASSEGILVAAKSRSDYIKPFVDSINQQIMFAEKSWGSYRVLEVEEDSMTVKVTLNPGHGMNYHSHEKRDEIWNVVRGSGYAVLDGKKKTIKPGDVILMPAGCKHTVVADTELQLIEVQLGTEISVVDKHKHILELSGL